MTKPTVVFVPGLWEGPQAYVEVRSLVAQAGYETVAAALVSTGKAYNKDPPSPSMYDDIATIRSTVETLVSADKEVVLVMHSAGGFLGSEAIENMTKAARLKQGREGGVSHLVSVSAALVPEGQEHTPAPFMENDVSDTLPVINTIYELTCNWSGSVHLVTVRVLFCKC